jgi:translation initiation factor 3 subunit D
MSVFNFEKADEDEAFELVDNKPVKKTYGQTQRRPQNQGRWGQQQGQGARQDGRGPQKQRQQGGFRQQQWKDQARERTYSSSIVIQPDWHVLGDQIALSALQKLSSKSGEPEELVALGSLALYDRAADRVGPKTPAKLQPPKVRARAASTWEDPVMQKLAAANEGDVFMTDAILSVIMTAPRSVHSWDIVVIKKGSQIFF